VRETESRYLAHGAATLVRQPGGQGTGGQDCAPHNSRPLASSRRASQASRTGPEDAGGGTVGEIVWCSHSGLRLKPLPRPVRCGSDDTSHALPLHERVWLQDPYTVQPKADIQFIWLGVCAEPMIELDK